MNFKQQRFITEFLRYGDKVIAYQTAYENPTTNPETAISAANRLLRMPEIREAIEAAQTRIRNQVEYELKQELKQELLTIQRKRELLAQIATGEALVEQHTKGKDCNMCTILQKPNFNQMLKAIDLDSKLAGHYHKHSHDTVRPAPSTQKATTKQPDVFYSAIEEELYRNDEKVEAETEKKVQNPQQNETFTGAVSIETPNVINLEMVEPATTINLLE